jgi:hypothetical protein
MISDLTVYRIDSAPFSQSQSGYGQCLTGVPPVSTFSTYSYHVRARSSIIV